MRDTHKTKQQLVSELEETHQHLAELEALEAECKRVEEALRHSEQEKAAILESMSEYVVYQDTQNRILWANQAAADSVGLTTEKLNGSHCYEIWQNRSEPCVGCPIVRARESGQPQEAEITTPDGRMWLIRGYPIRDENGDIVAAVEITSDITECKWAEEELQTILETAPDGFCIVNLEGRFVEVNDSYCQMTGYTREELLKMSVQDIEATESSEEAAQHIKRVTEQGSDRSETRHKCKDGNIIDVEVSINYLDMGEGQFFVCARDITERKRAEEALRQEKDMAQKYLDIAGVIIVAINYKGEVILINKKGCDVLGCKEREIIGNNWFDNFIPERLSKQTKEVSLKLLDGKIELAEYHENPVLNKNGEERLIAWHNAILRDEAGNIIGHLSSGEDITERKQTEEELRASEEKFSKAFHAIPDLVCITTLEDGNFIEVNDSFTRITGYTRKEAIGRSSTELGLWVNPEERTRVIKILKEKGRVGNKEFDFRVKSGEIRTWRYSAELINFGGKICILTITTDITELKQAMEKVRETETLREINELRTELLANISHELRTPLTSIKGFATMLLDYDRRLKRPEKRGYLQTIDKNTDRLAELIEQLLDMSRLEAGMLKINKKPTTINKLCQEATAEAQVRSPTHRFVLDLAKKLPRVNVDARRLRQVLDNLISNAIQYSQPGTEVIVAARQVGHELLVSVTDRGIGIPEKDLPRVFERMFRSQQRLILEAGGAGLGLPICKGLVEAHDGRIWIESEEDKETRCFFTLPIYTKPGDSNAKES